MQFAAIVVAAGSGRRVGGAAPKQWRPIGGRPMARWSLDTLAEAGADPLVLVVAADQHEAARRIAAGVPRLRIVTGGTERIRSVEAGLAALPATFQGAVLVHDAARPFVAPAHVQTLLEALQHGDGALPALPVPDTLKRANVGGVVEATVDRAGLHRAQTPQAFRAAVLKAAYAAWPAGETPTDDARVVERAGGTVRLVAGDPRLMKVTVEEDFAMAEEVAAALARPLRLFSLVGQGLDAHRLAPVREGDDAGVWLCGVLIPHDHMLVGHSDADAGLHALTDAILGAIGEGDIGDHFPPTDPRWRGAPSHLFLTHALELVRRRGGRLVNVDVTLVCERPRIKPHREAMRGRLAELLALPLARVSVKATTTERMGFTGREEGVLASAIASIEAPDPAASDAGR